MTEWINDTISSCNWNRNRLFFNSVAADSTARWWQNQVTMASTNTWAGVPYAFPEDMFNPWTIWTNACNSVNYNSNMFYNPAQSWFNITPTTPTTPSSKKDDTPKTKEEEEAQEEYNQLKDLLQGFSKDVLVGSDLSQSDKDLKDDIKNAINKKGTYKEKCDELRAIYDRIKNDLDEYIEDYITIKPFGSSSVRVNVSYVQIGNHADSDITGNVNSIRDDFAFASGSDPNLSSLTNIDDTNVIAVISCYNDKEENFAKELQEAYRKASEDPNGAETAKRHVNLAIDALKTKAKAIAAKMDQDTKDKIERLAENLPEVTDNNNFVEKFNELYVLVRLSMAKLVDNALEGKFGKIDSSFAHATTDAKDDIKKELNKVSELSINPETIANGIKVKPGRSYTSTRRTEEDNKKLNEKDNEEKIKTLIDGNYLCQDGTTSDGEAVYKAVHNLDLKPHYFILDENGLFYEVDKQADGTYKVKEGGAGLQASDLKSSGDKAKHRNEQRDAIDARKNDDNYPIKKTSDKKFVSTGDSTTTKGVEYGIYKVDMNGKEQYYILNNEGKLEEVKESTNGQFVKESGEAKTLEDLTKEINRAKDEANRERKGKLENPIKETSILVLDNCSIGRSTTRWFRNRNKGQYMDGLRKSLKAYNEKPAETTYTDTEWTNAYNALINYYEAAYKALGTIDTEDESLSEWCNKQWRGNKNQGVGRTQGLIKGNKTITYYDGNGNECTFIDESTFKIDNEMDNVNSFDKISGSNVKSTSGLYIGCDFDCSMRGILGFGHKNDFYFYLDSETVFKKFKSFLPK